MSALDRSIMICLLLLLILTAGSAGVRAQVAEEAYQVEINKGQLVRLDRPAASVVIANPTIADVQVVSPRLIYINGKKTGETSVFAVDANDREIINATVTVTHNLSKLEKALQSAMPGSEVKVASIDGGLVLEGSVASPLEADQVNRLATPFLGSRESLINMMQTQGSDQVMLNVKVAEVARSELKRFGINLSALLTSGNFLFGIAQGRPILDASGQILRNANDNSLFGSFSGGNVSINSIVDALQSDGLMSVLAEPSLTAISGKTANFLAGGEFPVPTVGPDNTVTITYKPFGVSLSFTPVVLSKDKINLTVAPEVSTLSTLAQVTVAGFNIPSLSTRRSETTVELGSGQTFAIAGLLQNNSSNDIDKFPGLGDLPILGALFRSSEFRHDQTELVILVTPYIVNGVSEKLATPLDNFTEASDIDRILFGKLYKEQAKSGKSITAVPLYGPAGFILR